MYLLKLEGDVIELVLSELEPHLHLVATGVPSVDYQLVLKVKSESIVAIEKDCKLFGDGCSKLAIPVSTHEVSSFVGD